MNTHTATEEIIAQAPVLPGATLAAARAQKGYSVAYVAGKLHLRSHLIECLEADDYANMPEQVFIQGYIRAYAKLLELDSASLLEIFNQNYSIERKVGRTLWQGQRETNRAEHVIRWLTGIFALVVVVAVFVWWQSNKNSEHYFAPKVSRHDDNTHAETEIRLTDLSKMRSILSSNSLSTPNVSNVTPATNVEQHGE